MLEPFTPISNKSFQTRPQQLYLGVYSWYDLVMPKPERSKEPDLSQVEAVLVDVVRLAARDDASAIPRRIRRWLGSPATRRSGVSESLRAQMLAALDAPNRQGARVRRTVAEPREKPQPAATPAIAERPVLEPHVEEAIDRLTAEYQRRDELSRHGLVPTRTLLLSGPPGVGKTMTATWLAARLDLPLLSIEPSGVMTSLLGESARNLVAALDEARETPCVVLLDEIDAFGKSRDDTLDVGELKRLVTTLLVELDRWPPGNLLVGATNHPDLLDHALARRFEVRLALGVPGSHERRTMFQELRDAHCLSLDSHVVEALVMMSEGCSGSDIRTMALRGIRSAVLAGDDPSLALLREALPAQPQGMSRDARARFAQVAHSVGGLTHRQIGDLLDCSHTAAGKLVRAEAA
jgi:hypothetical protein